MTSSERNPHVHADVIRAYADGHKIEWSMCPDGSWWQAIEIPTFFSSYFYRVKPEPPPEPKTWYQVAFKDREDDDPKLSSNLYTEEKAHHHFLIILKLIPVYTEE